MAEHPVERIKKFLLLLGSTHDGEVVAAARALVRYLDSLDLDLHNLCNLIERGANPLAPTPPQQVQPRWETVSDSEYLAMARWIRDQPRFEKLPEKTRRFVLDQCDWLVFREPSEKQAAWLNSIARNMGYKKKAA